MLTSSQKKSQTALDVTPLQCFSIKTSLIIHKKYQKLAMTITDVILPRVGDEKVALYHGDSRVTDAEEVNSGNSDETKHFQLRHHLTPNPFRVTSGFLSRRTNHAHKNLIYLFRKLL